MSNKLVSNIPVSNSTPYKLYFPPCGFGFWYLLAKLSKLQELDIDYELSGSSSGSLICLLSLIDKRYHSFEFMMEIAKDIRRNIAFPLNLYNIVREFVDRLLLLARETNPTRLRTGLSKIKIQVTEVTFKYYVVPVLTKHQVTPTSLEHLRELCLASSYIPVLSRKTSILSCFYNINDMMLLDGGVADILSNVDTDIITFDRTPSRLLRIPTEDECKDMYRKGMSESIRKDLNITISENFV